MDRPVIAECNVVRSDIMVTPMDSIHDISILASFYVWKKYLKCKVAVNRDSTIQSLQVRRNSSSL
jgi:hypothetical protein